MSASDDIWILGIHMTKFGKHFDQDVVDLGAEAITGALGDAGVTMADIGVLAAGNLMGRGRIAQQLHKQVGQTGVRDEGGPSQIEGATVGLAHVIGLRSACGVHILEKSGLAAA